MGSSFSSGPRAQARADLARQATESLVYCENRATTAAVPLAQAALQAYGEQVVVIPMGNQLILQVRDPTDEVIAHVSREMMTLNWTEAARAPIVYSRDGSVSASVAYEPSELRPVT